MGGPQANELVHEAASRKLVNFEGLKADGFILRTLRLEGRRVLVAGGNEEAATMYAVYDLLERYGAAFLLTGEILPEKKADLELRDFEVRSDPAFRLRGLLLSFNYPHDAFMSMEDGQKFLDQMAKMKMNYLHLFWNPYEPWIKYEYRGEPIWMGDLSRKDTGYLMWAHGFGSSSASDMKVGQEQFKKAGDLSPGMQRRSTSMLRTTNRASTPRRSTCTERSLMRQAGRSRYGSHRCSVHHAESGSIYDANADLALLHWMGHFHLPG